MRGSDYGVASAPHSKHDVQRIDLSWLPRYSGLLLLAVIVGLFAALRPDTFATGQNLRIILGGQAIAVILALAVLLPLSADILDISVAGTMGLAVITVGWFQFQGFNPILAIVLALLIGIAVGVVNSTVIIKFRVPSLIATLGMASILDATGFWVTSGNGVSSGMSSGFERFGQAKLWGTPVTVFYMLGVAAVLYYVLEKTPAGRYVRAIGGNAEAARLSGIRVNRIAVVTLIVSALIATIAGIIYAANLGSSPIDSGDPYLLSTFSAAFLGATQFKKNQFNVLGTILAVYLLATLVNGLQLVYPGNGWLSQMFEGLALIVAVGLSVSKGALRRSRPLEDYE